jgi:glycosyltransferase involved in cell wall biosynthesis
MKNSPNIRVVFYPSLQKMIDNPYWVMLADGLREAGVEIVEEPESHKFVWLLKKRGKSQIIHLHFFQSLYCNSGHTRARLVYVLKFALYLLLARLLGYKTVLTLHNLKPTHPLKPGWIDFFGHWVAVNLTDRVIVHCQEARRLMAARYGRKSNVFEVHHPNYIGYYPNHISQVDARSKLNIPETTRVFLFLGGVRPNKGIETLISAFHALEGDDLILLIAGKAETNNNYAHQLVEQAKGDHRIRIHLGFIPDNELQEFFNACDIVVLPFSSVLTSGSAILAMSFARPVIAPSMGCLPELLEPDAGWLFEAGNQQSLNSTMNRVKSEDLSRKGINAFKRASDVTKSQFIIQTIRCYGADAN